MEWGDCKWTGAAGAGAVQENKVEKAAPKALQDGKHVIETSDGGST